MATAFVLIKTRPGHEHDVYYSLTRRRRFNEIHPITGDNNFIATVTSENIERIEFIVLEELGDMENVDSYEILVSMISNFHPGRPAQRLRGHEWQSADSDNVRKNLETGKFQEASTIYEGGKEKWT